VGAIALVQYEPDAGMQVRELSKPRALSAMLASLMPTGIGASEFLDSCIEMVSNAQTIQLTFSESAAAADFLASQW
jgi:hypothetical protein